MAAECNMHEAISELSKLLQIEKDLRAMEQLRATEREKALRSEMEKMRETIINQETIKYKALERERDNLLKEVEHLKRNDSAFSDIMDKYNAEKAEKESIREKIDDLQKEIEHLKSQLHEEKDLHVERQLRDSERKKALRKQIHDLKEQICTVHNECADSFVPKLKALERENAALISQIEQLMMSCKDNNLTFKDLSEKDKTENTEKVTEMLRDDDIQELNSLVQKKNDVCTQEELKASEGENVPYQDTCDLEDKLQSEGSECMGTLGSKLEALESHNKVLSNEVEQLKMSFERMAEKYMAEKTEKEALQINIQELKFKLQNELDFCTQQQLKASEREKVFCQEIDDLRETLEREREQDSKLQAWERERKAYIQEIADLKLCYEGKTLRFNEMFEKLKAEKAHKEAIKEEQFKRIQALSSKVRQQQDFCSQEKLKASEREKVLSLKLEELKEKISCFEKGANPELTATSDSTEENSDSLQGEGSGEQKKTKKRKGWKKVVYYAKPWHWGKK